MNIKRKIAWILTGGLLWSTIFDGGYLIAAVAGQNKALIEEYAAWDIERKGGSYYYQGDRVKVIKDQSQNGSVYKFDPKLDNRFSLSPSQHEFSILKMEFLYLSSPTFFL